MKRLKLFPKIFLYTLAIMLFVVVVTHGLIYLLAPRMQLAVSTPDDVVISIRQEQFLLPSVFQGDCRPYQKDFCVNRADDEIRPRSKLLYPYKR